MKQFEQLEKWCDSKGEFPDYVTASIRHEAIELSLFNYQDDWYIKPVTKLSKEDETKLDLQNRIMPLFEEILKFEDKEIVYNLLYISQNMPIKQYTKQYHFQNETDFDILIKSVKKNDKNVEGLIQIQLNEIGEIDNIKSLKSTLESTPYNFKGVVVYNKKLDQSLFFYGANFLNAKAIIDGENFNKNVYDIYKRGELTNFLVDYPEYRIKARMFVDDTLRPALNWLQIALERRLSLKSKNSDVQEIYNTPDMATFIKYEWKNVSFETFKIFVDEVLSYQESNEKLEVI